MLTTPDQTHTRSPWRDAGVILALISLVAMVLYFALYLVFTAGPRDWSNHIVGRDFVNTWMGARAVLADQLHALLNVDAHNRALKAVLGDMPPHNWSYPPVLLLFVWPLGYFGYLPALAIWSALGYAAYVAAAATHDRSLRSLLLVAGAPAIAVNLFSGQIGFFIAAILILFFRTLDKRPWLAGAILGLMLIKPHLVVLFPIALALSGRWRTFAGAAVTVAALIGVTALVFGPGIWPEYFHQVMPVQRGILLYGTGFVSMMPTGFMHARLIGLPLALCWKVQLPFTLLALAAVIWTFAKRRDPQLSIAVLLTASIIVTPYSFNYDMVAFGWLTALLWPRFNAVWDRTLLITIWLLPLVMTVFGDAGVPVAAPILAVFLVHLLLRLRTGETARTQPA